MSVLVLLVLERVLKCVCQVTVQDDSIHKMLSSKEPQIPLKAVSCLWRDLLTHRPVLVSELGMNTDGVLR